MAIDLALLSISLYAQNIEPFVIPKLREWKAANGQFQLKSTVNLIVSGKPSNGELEVFLQTFAKDLKTLYPQKKINIKQSGAKDGDIVFVIYSSISD